MAEYKKFRVTIPTTTTSIYEVTAFDEQGAEEEAYTANNKGEAPTDMFAEDGEILVEEI